MELALFKWNKVTTVAALPQAKSMINSAVHLSIDLKLRAHKYRGKIEISFGKISAYI